MAHSGLSRPKAVPGAEGDVQRYRLWLCLIRLFRSDLISFVKRSSDDRAEPRFTSNVPHFDHRADSVRSFIKRPQKYFHAAIEEKEEPRTTDRAEGPFIESADFAGHLELPTMPICRCGESGARDLSTRLAVAQP